MLTRLIQIDQERCVGCRTCETVCSLIHEDCVAPSLARIKVIRWEAQGHAVPLMCRQCEDAPCEAVCPVGAITRDAALGRLVMDATRCIGCRSCVFACPFGVMAVRQDTRKVFTCDLCDGDPQCVVFCAYDALSFVPCDEMHADRRFEAARRLHDSLQGDAPSI